VKLRAAAVVACLALALAFVAACSDQVSHILSGRFYVEGRGCLGTPSSVDVVSGGDPGTCAPACIVQQNAEGGPAVYITTTCPPYSPDYDTTATNLDCTPALAAFARDDTCESDGASTDPIVPEAGTDASDAAADGS
jgi:hypothetical protein